jgi:hypothetical protein
MGGRVSLVSIATRYGLDGTGIKSFWGGGGGGIFRTRLDRTLVPPRLLYNGYRVFCPGVKRPGRDVDHLPPSNTEVKERVELYLSLKMVNILGFLHLWRRVVW